MSNPWDIRGVEEKLKRSHENIVNLTDEINAILGPDRHRVIGDGNEQAVKKFVDSHLSRPVSPGRRRL